MYLGSGFLIFSQTEICQLVHAPAHQNVLRIEISVLDSLGVQLIETEDQVRIDFQDFSLREWRLRCYASLNLRLERARGGQLKHYARLLEFVHKVIFDFDHERMVDLTEHSALSLLMVLIFVAKRIKLPLGDFHGESLPVRFPCDAEHLGERSSSQQVLL